MENQPEIKILSDDNLISKNLYKDFTEQEYFATLYSQVSSIYEKALLDIKRIVQSDNINLIEGIINEAFEKEEKLTSDMSSSHRLFLEENFKS